MILIDHHQQSNHHTRLFTTTIIIGPSHIYPLSLLFLWLISCLVSQKNWILIYCSDVFFSCWILKKLFLKRSSKKRKLSFFLISSLIFRKRSCIFCFILLIYITMILFLFGWSFENFLKWNRRRRRIKKTKSVCFSSVWFPRKDKKSIFVI